MKDGIHADLSDYEVLRVCQESRSIFLNEGTLLRLQGPITIVGDIHGQFQDLLSIFDGFEKIDEHTEMKEKRKFLFLGDLVDRGKNSIEVVVFLFALKILYPDRIFIIRGNHEVDETNKFYGFLDEIMEVFDEKQIWFSINDVFNCLPIAAVINDRIFCVHGGISPHLTSLKDIEEIQKPIIRPETGLVCDMLWSDPKNRINDFQENEERGLGCLYGKKQVKKFLSDNNLRKIIRGHQVVQNGFEFPFKNSKKILTIHSAPGFDESGDEIKSAVVCVNSKDQFDVIHTEDLKDDTLSEPSAQSEDNSMTFSLEIHA